MNIDNFEWDESKAIEFAAFYDLASEGETEFVLYKYLDKFKQYKNVQEKQYKTKPKNEYEILNYEFIKYPETKTVDTKEPRIIHSVKRLSDGEVFTIGDNVFYANCLKKNPIKWVIDNFYITEHGTMIARSKDNQMVEFLEQIKKLEDKQQSTTETIPINDVPHQIRLIKERLEKIEQKLNTNTI